MDEKVNGKPHMIAQEERTKVAITYLVQHQFGNREGTNLPISMVRLRYLLYLADLDYHTERGETYLGSWIYANNGPLLHNLGNGIAELDGMEIIKKGEGFVKGNFNRYSTWMLDTFFKAKLVEIKKKHFFKTDNELSMLIYESQPMQGITLGDYLFQ